jgi:hypothetical protein
MIITRIANALRNQDWLSVVIELVLVVAGILIALQIDNWNDVRQENAEESKYLAALQAELDQNAEELEFLIEFSNSYLDSINLLLRSIDLAADEVDRSAIDAAFGNTLSLYSTRLNRGVYSELVSSGKLQLIKSDEIKQGLISFYEELDTANRIEANALRNWETVYTPFLEAHFNVQPMFREWSERSPDGLFSGLSAEMVFRDLPEDEFWNLPFDAPEKMRFTNILTRRYSDQHFARWAQMDMLRRTRELMEMIESIRGIP